MFLNSFNRNGPGDLMAINIETCSLKFNLIGSEKTKTYHYYFSYGEKQHPYAAPFMVGFLGQLDIELMKKAAQLFQGEHHFEKYCCKPSKNTQFKRKIDYCSLQENTILKANFFPEKTYVFIVQGKGFLRYQIRYMMAVLIQIGQYKMTLEELELSLLADNNKKSWHFIAPSSGLHLHTVSLISKQK